MHYIIHNGFIEQLCMSETVIGTGDKAVKTEKENPSSHKVYILVRDGQETR